MSDENIQRLDRDIGRLEGKVEAMSSRMGNIEVAVRDGFASVEKQLGELKENRAAIKGGWWALTAILAIAATLGGSVSGAIKALLTGQH
jgi:hypothetical protein